MLSFRRSFRKPLGFCFLFIFFWMFVFQEEEHQETVLHERTSSSDDVRDSGFQLKKIKHHENAENVIFGQGLFIPHSSSHPKNSAYRQMNDAKIKEKFENNLQMSYRYDGKTRSSFVDRNFTAYIKVPSVSDVQENNVQEDPPDRYKNVIPDQLTNVRKDSDVSYEGTPHSSRTLSHEYPSWIRISNDIYIYSGFWDHRPELEEGPVARMLGILRFSKEILYEDAAFRWNSKVKVDVLNCSCVLWYKGNEKGEKGVFKAAIFEERRQTFAGTYFFCYPQGSNETRNDTSTSDTEHKRIPYAVSLYPNNMVNAPYKLIYLKNNSKGNTNALMQNNSTAVCVRALYGPYNDVRGMVQFISYYNTILKVSHFYFYDLAIDSRVSEVIGLFRSLGLTIEILPWNIPTSEWEELWDVGSLTALNDCVYRSSGQHALVAIVDLDEFIVPKEPVQDLSEIYKKVIAFRRGHHGDAVLILNAFFCFDFKGSGLGHNNRTGFSIFDYSKREVRLWPPKSRSKILVVPETVIAVGHHMVHRFVSKDFDNQSSPKLVSFLHHYRLCKDVRLGIFGTGKPVLTQATMKDVSIMKYKMAVMNSKTMKLYKRQFE